MFQSVTHRLLDSGVMAEDFLLELMGEVEHYVETGGPPGPNHKSHRSWNTQPRDNAMRVP